MDTSNSLFSATDFTFDDLRASTDPEEKIQAAKALELFREVQTQLKPIVRYVTTPYATSNAPTCASVRTSDLTEYRLCFLGEQRYGDGTVGIYLNEHCEVVVTKTCCDKRKLIKDHLHYQPLTWSDLPFSAVLAGLQAALQRAAEIRKKHLEAIEARGKMLDRMMAAVNETKENAQ